MQTYIIRRLLLIVPTVFIVTVIVFFSVRLIPGDVVDMMVMGMARGRRRRGSEGADPGQARAGSAPGWRNT